ncbi:hypothetical protein, partial [Nocardia sp. NPDC058497]|uniref:hypothetical protein n=1 Tax=Nocardia sp. NPDC058497 TaxID=3346529 RepID=UPI0036523E5D
MRFVKTSTVALAIAALSIFGAGMAQAATVKVTGQLVGCAFSAGVSTATTAELTASLGSTITLSASAEAELEA